MSETDAAKIAADLEATTALAAKDDQIATLTAQCAELTDRAGTAEARVLVVEGWLGGKDQEIATLRDSNEKLAAELATRPEAVTPKAPSIRLTAPHGFIEDATGIQRNWQAGQIVTDPGEMALLRERKAPIIDVI
jgi:hypothetical protein